MLAGDAIPLVSIRFRWRVFGEPNCCRCTTGAISFNPLSLESVWRERFFAQVSVFQAAMSENPPRRCKYFGRKFSKLCKKAFVFLQMTILALRFPRRIVLSLNGLHSF